MSVKIFAMTHKNFIPPNDRIYEPLQVGKCNKASLGYIGDDTGDNISNLNCYYSELTGMYWIWKNYHDSDYVGICHYRRYLINEEENLLTEEEIENILKNFDIITTKKLTLNFSYHYGFGENHNIKDLDATGEVIKEKYPDYYDTFLRLVNSNHTYFGNIMICSKELYDEYCEWMFSIFFEVHKRIDVESYDDYHKRVYGFISEFLLYVWLTVKGLKVFECKVGMVDEKAETREMKIKMAEYFAKADIDGAKKYFLEVLARRPDVMMEASDITGELRICMQVISTAEFERENETKTILNKHMDFDTLMKYFRQLNKSISNYIMSRQTEQDKKFLIEEASLSAIRVAVNILCTKDRQDVLAVITGDISNG